jgi:hypothetical protein
VLNKAGESPVMQPPEVEGWLHKVGDVLRRGSGPV